MKTLLRVLILAATILVAACGRDNAMMLIPQGNVEVYDAVEGGELIGVTTERLRVQELVYKDKTDYVVKVSYRGQSGYVRSGRFVIKHSEQSQVGS